MAVEYTAILVLFMAVSCMSTPEVNVTTIVPQCGLMAFETRQFFKVQQEQTVQVNVKLKLWKDLGLKVHVLVEKFFSFDVQTEPGKTLIPIFRSKSSINQEKIKEFVVTAEKVKENFKINQESVTDSSISTINFEPLQTEREVMQPRIEKLFTDHTQITTAAHVTSDILSLIADFIYHQQALTNVELMIDHYAEQIAYHLHDAATAECRLDLSPGVDWVIILIKHKLHWPAMSIKRPCFLNDSWITEFSIHAFPFQKDDEVQVTILDVSLVWMTQTKVLYEGISELLQEYDDELQDVYWISTLPGTEVSTDVRSTISEVPAAQLCKSEILLHDQKNQVLPLGTTAILYYASTDSILYFYCGSQIITKSVNMGLIEIQTERDCKFVYPKDAEVIDIDVKTDNVVYKYVPILTVSNSTTSKVDRDSPAAEDDVFNLNFKTYLLYGVYAFLTLGVTGCCIWNVRSLRCIFRCIQKSCSRRSDSRNEQSNSIPQQLTYSAPSSPVVTYAFQMM
jgi:hypothetical protein